MSRNGLAVFLALASLPSFPSASTLDQIRQRGTLIWGGDVQGGEPYVFENPANPKELIGFEVDIAAELAGRLGVTAVFKQTAWSNLVPSLERRDFDIALNGLEATTDRQDRVLMSRPYYVYAETLAIRKGDTYRALTSLKGKRVGTLNQTFANDLLIANGFDPASYGGLYEGVQEPYLDLVNGKLDAVLLDNIIADRYGCSLPGIECVDEEMGRGVYVILFRKSDEALKAEVDRALNAMIDDGTMETILTSWKLWDHRQQEPLPEISTVERERSMSWNQFWLFVKGAGVTLQLSLAAFALAVPLGFGLACGRLYGPPWLRFCCAAYVEIFRGTPVLLQLYVLYFGIAPYIKLGAIQSCILGLGLNYAAYEAEIYRGALLALPRGQTEAAHSLGLNVWQTLRHALMPQAFRIALPSMTNDFIALLKDSSLVGVIAVVELTKRMTIAAVDMRSWLAPGLLCAGLYFAMSFPLARWARRMEKRMRRDHHPSAR
jgi:polar amino acid transport system substrate-binding protein